MPNLQRESEVKNEGQDRKKAKRKGSRYLQNLNNFEREDIKKGLS